MYFTQPVNTCWRNQSQLRVRTTLPLGNGWEESRYRRLTVFIPGKLVLPFAGRWRGTGDSRSDRELINTGPNRKCRINRARSWLSAHPKILPRLGWEGLPSILQRIRGGFRNNVWGARAAEFDGGGKFHEKLGAEGMKSTGPNRSKLGKILICRHFTRNFLILEQEDRVVNCYRSSKIPTFYFNFLLL